MPSPLAIGGRRAGRAGISLDDLYRRTAAPVASWTTPSSTAAAREACAAAPHGNTKSAAAMIQHQGLVTGGRTVQYATSGTSYVGYPYGASSCTLLAGRRSLALERDLDVGLRPCAILTEELLRMDLIRGKRLERSDH